MLNKCDSLTSRDKISLDIKLLITVLWHINTCVLLVTKFCFQRYTGFVRELFVVNFIFKPVLE